MWSCARAPTPLTCERVTGPATNDLAASARLSASETGRTAPYPWVLEETQAIATVRDDAPDTAWLLPSGDSTVRIDWQPWIAAPIALGSLHLGYTTATRPHATVELTEWCGGPSLKKLDASSGDVDLGNTCAGCVEIHFTSDTPTSLAELHLLTADVRAAPRSVPTPSAATTARYDNSGIVEGFYGVPWSWRERYNMVATLAANGMGTYIYAPKNDALHRDQWRTPYPADAVQRFIDLHTFAKSRHVTLYLGLSPFVDFDATTDGDYQTLLNKLKPFVQGGFSDFVLLADDIEQNASLQIDGALGATQVSVVNRLLADLRALQPDVRFLFVPTVYNTVRIQSLGQGADYLARMSGLDASIGFMWTGNDTGNVTITGADLAQVTSVTGRAPIIWDNFYANDGGDGFQGRLFLGAYSGRSADLPAAAAGIVNNMSIQGGLSRLGISTVGDYLDHPAAPDESRARARATQIESAFALRPSTDPNPAVLLGRTMDLFNGSSQTPQDLNDLRCWTGDLEAALPAGPADLKQYALPVLAYLGPLAVLSDQVRRSSLDPDLADELVFPLDKVRLEAEGGLHTLQLLSALKNDADDSASRDAADAALGASALSRFAFGAGEIQHLHDAVIALPSGPRTLTNPIPATAPSCAVGKSVSFSAARVSDLFVFGPLEAEGNGVKWTPTTPGTVATAEVAFSAEAPTWFWRPFSLQCGR
jgi:hypothetical protein